MIHRIYIRTTIYDPRFHGQSIDFLFKYQANRLAIGFLIFRQRSALLIHCSQNQLAFQWQIYKDVRKRYELFYTIFTAYSNFNFLT